MSREAAVTAAARGLTPATAAAAAAAMFILSRPKHSVDYYLLIEQSTMTYYSILLHLCELQQLVVVRPTFARFSGLDRREETEQ